MPPLSLPPFLEVHAAAQAFLGVFAVKRVMGRWGTEASCREATSGVMEVGGSTPAGDNEAMNDSMNGWLGGRCTAFPPPVLPHPPPPPWWGEEAGGTVPRWRRRVGSRRKLGPHEPSPAVGDCYLKKKKSRLLTKILVRRWCRWSDVPSYNVHVVKSTFVVEILS